MRDAWDPHTRVIGPFIDPAYITRIRNTGMIPLRGPPKTFAHGIILPTREGSLPFPTVCGPDSCREQRGIHARQHLPIHIKTRVLRIGALTGALGIGGGAQRSRPVPPLAAEGRRDRRTHARLARG